MPYKNYDELQAEVGKLIRRPNLVNEIASWIFLTEIEYQRDCNLPSIETKVDGVLVDAQEYIELPADWLWTHHFRLNTDPLGEIKVVSLAMLNVIKENSKGGLYPTHGTVRGLNLELAPVPTEATPFTHYYQSGGTHLSDTNQTSWLLTNAPDGLLYGAALHSAPYLVDDPRLATWGAFHTKAKNSVKRLAFLQRSSGGPLRQRVEGATP
jgi:hypothetical protein